MEAGLQKIGSCDSFGSRTGENFSGSVSGDVPIPQPSSVSYNAHNQVQSVSGGYPPEYDAAGDITCDSYNAGACYGMRLVSF